MEITVLKKHQSTFNELENRETFININDNDLMVKIDNIKIGEGSFNSYSIKINRLFDLNDKCLVKKVRIKEIIVEEV